MKYVHHTWYLLVDGTYADPNDVATGEDGVLRHKDGLAVALHENGVPQTIGMDAVENKNVEAAEAGEQAAASVEKQKSDDEAAAKGEEALGDAPVTKINPETGKGVEPEEKKKPAAKDVRPATVKRGYKTRELKGK